MSREGRKRRRNAREDATSHEVHAATIWGMVWGVFIGAIMLAIGPAAVIIAAVALLLVFFWVNLREGWDREMNKSDDPDAPF